MPLSVTPLPEHAVNAVEVGPRVLFLCTGNLCRSPIAEALVRVRAGLSGSRLQSSSAGFVVEGQTPPPATLAVMKKRGIDLADHRSRVLSSCMLEGIDLVLGMTREHVWEAALLDPDVIPRAFVLGEFVRLNRGLGGRRAAEPFEGWVQRLHASRRHSTSLGSAADEIPDPFGRSRRVHEQVASQIERHVLELADCAFDPQQPEHTRSWREARVIGEEGSAQPPQSVWSGEETVSPRSAS